MSDIVNLNRYRKNKKRVVKENLAEENRTKFGRTKGQKKYDKKIESDLAEHVDAHKREDN